MPQQPNEHYRKPAVGILGTQQNFQDASLRRTFHGPQSFGQPEFFADKTFDVNHSHFEQLQSRPEPPATRPHHADFLNYYAGCVHFGGAVKSRLEHEHATWTQQVERERESRRRAGSLDRYLKFFRARLGFSNG